MERKKFIFVGNRFYVLHEMMQLEVSILKIYVVKGSFLESELAEKGIGYTLLPGRDEFINELLETDFDCLISNGCPYIIPVSRMSSCGKKFINIHPSLLPDLKGKNPVNGALLFNRKHGVTCHYMDDGIDTGALIEQIEIPLTDDVNLDLLYQISFRAEGIVFRKAYEKNFRILETAADSRKYIYYTKKEADRRISPDDSAKTLLRKIKAFGSENQYAYFIKDGQKMEILSAVEIRNETAVHLFRTGVHNMIRAVYGNRFVLSEFDGTLIQFQLSDVRSFKAGDVFLK